MVLFCKVCLEYLFVIVIWSVLLHSHELQSFSDLMIAFRFSNERTKRFPGNCLDHASGFPPFSSNDTSWRHIGHFKPVDLSHFTDDVIYVWMHVSQNVWRYGRYFGTLNVSRHIVQISRSSTALSTLVELAILFYLYSFVIVHKLFMLAIHILCILQTITIMCLL